MIWVPLGEARAGEVISSWNADALKDGWNMDNPWRPQTEIWTKRGGNMPVLRFFRGEP